MAIRICFVFSVCVSLLCGSTEIKDNVGNKMAHTYSRWSMVTIIIYTLDMFVSL